MAINFPDPSASPWYNDPASGGNGVTYVYTSGGYWTAVQVTGSNAIDQTTGDARYVNVSGDNMTGTLNVGTTTGNAGRPLHIHTSGSGSSYFHSTNDGTGSAAADGLIMGMGDATNAYIWNYENGIIQFATNNSASLTLNANGSATFAGYVDFIRNAGNGFGYLGIGPGGTNEKATFVNRSGEIDFELYSNYTSSATVSINSDGSAMFAGNVGVGTSPSVLLHIAATEPQFYIQDTNSTGNNVNATLQFRDSSNTQLSYFGYASGSDSHLSLFNTMSGGDLRFGTASTERMRINTSGHVGIGKSPVDTNGYSRALDLTGSSGAAIYLRTNAPSNSTDYGVCGYYASDMYVGNYANGALRLLTGATERMRVASSGNIGIGTTSPYAILGGRSLGIANSGGHVELNFLGSTTSYQGIYFGKGTSGGDRLNGYIEYKQSDDFMRFASNYAERMRIDSSGDAHIGKTAFTGHNTNGHTFNNSGWAHHSSAAGLSTLYLNRSTSTSSSEGNIVEFYLGGTYEGNIYINSSGIYFNSVSDYRLKENVIDITDGITRLKQLSPRRFNFIKSKDVTVDGFIAHEVQTVVPEAVCGEKDGEEMQGMDHARLVPLLTAALQEAIAKIETLETKVAQLEAG